MNSEVEDQLTMMGMKNLLLEKELEKLEKSGLEIGHLQTLKKDEPVDVELFEHDILEKAKKMANFYIHYFSLENSVRKLISDVLGEKYGINWWDTKIPQTIQTNVKTLQEDERNNSAMSIRSEDPLAYTNFGELIDIFIFNWVDFSDILRSKKAVQDTLSPLNKIRNVIAHSCELQDDEILRFNLLIKDWLRIQN